MKVSWIILFTTVILSCNNTRVMSANSFDEYARTEQVEDSFLLSLQQSNDVVIAYAIESFAWVKAISYQIITLKDGEWKGYTYNKKITGGPVETHQNLSISKKDCDDAWKYIQTTEAWKIKGDSGTNFCSGDKKSNCNINDGVTWRLLIITKDKIIDPSYYEPEFYENCCPGNTDRKLFLDVVNKIKKSIKEGE